jgi:hypothetical protein
MDALADRRPRLELAAAGDEPHPVAVTDPQRPRVLDVDLDERLLLLVGHARLAHRHRRGVVVVERAPGREHERVLRVGLLDRRLVLDREEPALAVRPRGMWRVEVHRAGVVPVDARPLQADLVDPVVADPRPERRQVGELVPDVLDRPVVGPLGAELAGKVDHDSPVLAGLARARDRPADAVHATLRVGEGAVLLGEAGRGEDDVGKAGRRVVQEQVLGHHELEASETFLDVPCIRLGLRRVFADQVEGLDAIVVQPGHHLIEAIAVRLGQLDSPGRGKLAPDVGILLGLVARQIARIRTRVVQALDVVLAAQRVQPRRLVAEVAGHQHEVRE